MSCTSRTARSTQSDELHNTTWHDVDFGGECGPPYICTRSNPSKEKDLFPNTRILDGLGYISLHLQSHLLRFGMTGPEHGTRAPVVPPSQVRYDWMV